MLMQGKKGIIFGIANEKSIAWGCAKSLKAQGAEIGVTYMGEVMEKRVRPLGQEINAAFIQTCDLTKEEETKAVFETAAQTFGKIDFVLHSVAFASKQALSNPNISEVSLSDFEEALRISAWTFLSMARYAKPILNDGGSLLTLTYYGSQKAIANYALMGVAKAALEAEVRYLANEFGQNKIRVNAISAGAIRTLASSGIKNFKDFQSISAEGSCIKENVSIEQVGEMATFLLSPMSSGTTGQIIYVDHGYCVNH